MPSRARTAPTLLRLLLGVVVLCGLSLPVQPAAATPLEAQEPQPVVLFGIGGLRWSDLSLEDTPNLWEQAGHSATGAMSVRTLRAWTCPIDGWLTVSAAQRAAAPIREGEDGAAGCSEPPVPAPGGEVPGFSELYDVNANGRYEGRLGQLAAALERAGVCATAVGPGAALALATAEGTVERFVPADANVSPATYAGCPLTLVDVGAMTEPDEGQDGPWADAPTTTRQEQARALDRRFGELVAGVPDGATVFVAALSDSERFPHLTVAMARGPAPRGAEEYAPAWLRSASTRRPAIVQLTDVTPTLLATLGVDGVPGAVGSTWRTGDERPRDLAEAVAVLEDIDDAAQVVRTVVPPFYLLLVVAQIVLYGAAAVALRRQWGGPGRRLRVLRLTRRTALVFAAVPVATFLANVVPWWRAERTTLTLLACVVGAVAVVTLVAQGGPWRRWLLGPPGAIAALTGLVLGVDVMTGSTLQLSSLMGYSPVVAGRFYGFGNVPFALFATGAVLGVVTLAEPLVRRGKLREAVALAAVVGVAAVAIDGLPRWGSDFGGVLALVPGFAVLVLRLAGVRVSVPRALLIAAGSVATITVIAVLDWRREPSDRAHLGRFVQQVLDGEALPIVGRKLQANLDILFTNAGFSLLVPLGFAFVIFVLMRPLNWRAAALERAYDRAPTLRPGVVALVVTLVAGFAVNDSGIAIPAVGLTLAIPFLLAVSVTALERDEVEGSAGAPPTTPAAPSRRGASRA
jgi:hypothetical protein